MASLLYGLAGKLLGELGSPVFKDYVGKPWEFGTENEFEKLKNTLSAIEAVLLDAEVKQRTNHQLRDWLIKIKLVFYDVEDLLQEVTTEALKRQVMNKNKRAKEVRIFFSSSNQVKYRLKMGRKVKFIRESLDAIASDRSRFNLAEHREEMHVVRSNRREETHSSVPHVFIGRDKDIKDVTTLLLESDMVGNVSVISIVGIGGLGKTTLAQSIHSSEEVKVNFGLVMWVCVSDVFDVRLICEKIIDSATKRKCERLQMDGVKEELKRAIDGRKYLLVLDDVWNECPIEWMKLGDLLRGGAKGSKILITARAELVARAANSIATHVLKGLSQEDSWALFKQVAFKRVADPESSTIVGIGKEVVKTCAGVPLAIKTIGSMLGLKEREIDWLNFKKKDLHLATQDGDGKVVPILKLSYDYLPAPLKRCFVYCAVFPKDYPIHKENLIGMWMAQGFIQLDGTTCSLEDVGEQHFVDLLDRSFFEVDRKSRDGSIIYSYKMHDLIHDLALSVGGHEYYNLGLDVNHLDKTARHAFFSGDVSTNLLCAKKLRTLVSKRSHDILDGQMVSKIASNFKQMRVLRMSYSSEVPHFDDGLRHLNYLDLSWSSCVLLPESICRLYNLQTLILRCCTELKELPTGTRKLVSLRHLDISDCDSLTHMPCGVEELTCLRTLTEFVSGPEGRDCAGVSELKNLVNLRGALNITNLRGSKVVDRRRRGRSCYPYALSELKFIQELGLYWSGGVLKEEEEEAELLLFESLKPHPNLENLNVSFYKGKKFPGWMDRVNIMVSLPNIVSIRLRNNSNARHLPPMGLLPTLRTLELIEMRGIEYVYEEEEEEWNNIGSSSTPKSPDQHFPSLRTLSIDRMPQLAGLGGPTATLRHFPVLEKLEMRGDFPLFVADGKQLPSLREVCLSSMETLPQWLQSLPQLQSLTLLACRTLPEWLGNLTSLQEIHLDRCYSLETIPEWMRRLTSLQRLEIVKCPKLDGRCEKEVGGDWHKIAHIPMVVVLKKFHW